MGLVERNGMESKLIVQYRIIKAIIFEVSVVMFMVIERKSVMLCKVIM